MERSSRDLHLLEIEPNASEVRRSSEWLSSIAVQNQVPRHHIDRLDICLNEALANVLEHGNTKAVNLRFEISGRDGENHATVTVVDSGPPFDTTARPDVQLAQSLQDAKPGGLGLLMLRSNSDSLSYTRVSDRNELSFSVQWPKE